VEDHINLSWNTCMLNRLLYKQFKIGRSIVTLAMPCLCYIYIYICLYYCLTMGSNLNLRKWFFTSWRPTETCLEIQCMLNLFIYEPFEDRQTNGTCCCLKYNVHVCLTSYYINEFKICRSTETVVVPCLGYNTYTCVCLCVCVTV
jgi:hypothetical protein